ncbi:MAG: polysaccharide deacetylase family protein [Pseudolabrys sp.]|nr:polysaccharide deacetylase family protein [Pseudolabrys sp.]MBV9955463.1 polysaccharide deacetylase family protein [Pseudolabrys sp.]
MRKLTTTLFAAAAILAVGPALAQNAPASGAAIMPPKPICNNPNALGVSRTVEIDTTGAPGFGFEHFKAYDFLRDKEVVLTFDDGPWPNNTPMVLKALADQCTRATFFVIGKHAGYYPDLLKQVAAQGHTVGTHTWAHQDLSNKSVEEAKAEIEKGIAATSISLGNQPVQPFFRFPALRHPPEVVKYLAERNVGIFSTDFDSFDFKMRKPDQVIASVMKKLEKHGKGIVLMHDFQGATAQAVPELLGKLKAGGYKIVHITGKTPVEPIKEYRDAVLKEMGGGLENARPMSSVIRDVQ